MVKWHQEDIGAVLKKLGTSKDGLSSEAAKERQKRYGLNVIERRKKINPLNIFLRQFKSFLILLLIFAVIISFAIGSMTDAIIISVILILNALLGFWQEYKAEKSVEAIKKFIVQKAVVIRNGKETEIDSKELVPGDIVVLEEGERIPADLRLIRSFDLKTDESLLTGESVPVEKTTHKVGDVPAFERKNIAFMGTTVTGGRAIGAVVGIGSDTEIGKVAGMVEEKEEQTPLQKKLNKFGLEIGIFVIILTAIIFFWGYTMLGSQAIEAMLLTSISLAVSAVPEGLPAIITLTLAFGVQRISKRNAITRKISAIETLGATTVICADKTGTMTTNEMTAVNIWADNNFYDVTGVGFEPRGQFFYNKRKIDPLKIISLDRILQVSHYCNNSKIRRKKVDDKIAWKIIGDPTEGALKVLAKKAGYEKEITRIDEIAFSSERKMMTVINRNQGLISYTKGAPESVIDLCDRILTNGRIMKFANKEKARRAAEKMAEKGLRVLAFSYKDIKKVSEKSLEKNMIFVGLVGMIDPARKNVKKSIKLCRQAGIRTIMITGDHRKTAEVIGKHIGLKGKSITGKELDNLSDNEFNNIVKKIDIFARVSPEHKTRILKALKANGEIVAMTGDGVNDAPALKMADIGVAMGIKGTDVAKGASDIILMDDDFSTIVNAVEEGRGIYDNIRKFVRLLLSANFDELALIFSTIIFGLPLPLLPVHILWINLITDGLPALALSAEPKEADVMKRKPRDPKKGILNGMILFIIAAAIIGFTISFSLFIWEMNISGDIAKARTMVFTSIILFELFLVFNCRSETRGVWRNRLFTNKKLLAAVFASVMLQLLVIYWNPMQALFGTVALGFDEWIKILLVSSAGLLVVPEIFMRKF